jgi:gamma-glutamyltranspeptidase/glutathione hydrolase
MESKPRPFYTLNGAVATPNALASGTALRILSHGGNAIEAAIGAAATMAVVYPHMNGIGGDNVWLIYDAVHDETRALVGIGQAGRAATVDAYRQRGFTDSMPERGVLAVNTSPGAIDGWWEAYQYSAGRMLGQWDWNDLLRDAIQYADEGYPVTYSQAQWSHGLMEMARRYNVPGLVDTYLTESGKVPLVGQRQRFPNLSKTLKLIAKYGRDGFYQGTVAESIIEEIHANNGLLTLADWREPHAVWDSPLSLTYRGDFLLMNTPPPTQGIAALMIMGLLNQFPVESWDSRSLNYLHVMIESAKIALTVRNRELGDPSSMTVPAQDLLGAQHLHELANKIDPAGRASVFPTGPSLDGGTVAIVVHDNLGNAVSLIQSIYHDFGSGFVAKNSGVLLQNRGISFSLQSHHPNTLAPGKRPVHTLSAAMAFRKGRPILVYGTMGGDGQPQTQSALVTRVLDHGQNVVEALSGPRWLFGRTWGDTEQSVFLEGGFSHEVVEALRHRGHTITVLGPFDDKFGHAQAIEVNPTTSSMAAASDPRSDGGAYAW